MTGLSGAARRVIISVIAVATLLVLTGCVAVPFALPLFGKTPTSLREAAGRSGQALFDEKCGGLSSVAAATGHDTGARILTMTWGSEVSLSPNSLRCGMPTEGDDLASLLMSLSSGVFATWDIPPAPVPGKPEPKPYAIIADNTYLYRNAINTGSLWRVVDRNAAFTMSAQARPGVSDSAMAEALRTFYLSSAQPNITSPPSRTAIADSAAAAQVDACGALWAAATNVSTAGPLDQQFSPMFVWVRDGDGATGTMGGCSADLGSRATEVALTIARGLPPRSREEDKTRSTAELRMGGRTVYSQADAGRTVLVFHVDDLRVNLVGRGSQEALAPLMEQALEVIPGA